MMKMLYQDVEACVINSGTTSTYFPITRGVKQGDPPSGYLFILVAELLLIKFRFNKAIQGIEINRMEVKLSAYADDINNFLKNIASVRNTLLELERYEKVSGLRCNLEKCEIMALGNSVEEDIEFCGYKLKWVSEIVICGITFSMNSSVLISKNFDPVTEKLISKLNMWNMRDLSLIGKIQVLKTYGISQIQDVMNVIEPSNEILNRLNTIIFNFLWGCKIDKVKRKAIISDYDQGGLKAPDIFIIHKVQRIMWVSRYIHSSDHPWKTIFEWQLNTVGGPAILENTRLSVKSIDNTDIMPFYKSMIKTWGEWISSNLDGSNFLQQHLYFNNEIVKPNGESIFYNQLAMKGINKISDIVSNKKVIGFEEAVLKFSLNENDLIPFLSIKQCIESSHKELIESSLDYQETDLKTKVGNINSKKVNQSIRKKVSERPSSEITIEINFGISRDKWQYIYTIPFLATIESKLRAFQFKINHNIYFTNEKMAKANIMIESPTMPNILIKASPLCTFCKEEVETLSHLFIECDCVKKIWQELEKNLKYYYTNSQKIFGCFENTNDRAFDILSHLTIITKYYIHKCRLQKFKPSYIALKNEITSIESIELKIATKSNKIKRHLEKWDKVITLFCM